MKPDARAVALALAAAVLAAGCSRGGRTPATGSAHLTGPAAAVRGLAQIAAADSPFDRDRWDPDAVVSQVGKDPDRLFRWVRRNTHWVPYSGILRGPSGVLNDRLGNDLDRALLLAALLQRAGHVVRLAHAPLATEQVRAVLPRIAGEQVALAEGAVPFAEDPAAVEDIAGAAGPDAGPVGQALRAAADSLARASAELAQRTGEQTARLLHAVPRSDALAGRRLWFAAARAALADHWWVQRQSGAAWVDMDLLAEGSGPVVRGGTAVETADPGALAGTGLYQEIGVRVIAEYRAGQALQEKRILDYPLRPADVLGEPIVLQFWPARWFGDSVSRAELDRNPAKNLPEEHDFGVMLVVGNRTVAAAGFTDTGESPARQAAGAAGPMGGFAGAFSGTMGEKPARSGDLTAVWLEYEFRVPGEAPRTVRREVFDLIGPAARASGHIPAAPLDSTQRRTRALALVMRTELLPVSCRLSHAFVNRLAADALRGNARLFAAASGGAAPSVSALERLSAESAPLPTPLLTLAVARLAWSPYARQIYIGRAGLLTRHVYTAAAGGHPRFRDAVDIVANEVEVGPLARDPFAVRLGQGVFDTNAEALLWSGRGLGNTGDAYAASASWRTITPGDAAAIGGLSLPDDVKQRLRTDAASGNVVLAPQAEVRVGGEPFGGWWRVNPVSGATLGMGPNGWGVQAAEDAARTRQSITWSQYFKELARIAGPNFVKAFGQQMVICMAMTAGQDASAGKLVTLGVKGEASHGVHECTGDAIVIAGLATVPLLAITMNEMAAIRAARLAKAAAAAGEAANALGPKNPQAEPTPKEPNGPPGPPEGGNPEKPGPHNPGEPAGSDPSLDKTHPQGPDAATPQSPDLAKTEPQASQPPELAKTQPQTSQPPELEKTQPQTSQPPELAKTQPQGAEPAGAPGEKSPLAQTRPPGQSPYAETYPGSEPGKPAGNGPAPEPEPQQSSEPAPDDPQSPPDAPLDRSKLTPGRQQLLDMEQTLIELNADANAKVRALQQASGDYVRYEVNSPENGGRFGGDPSQYDPAVSRQLLDKYNAADAAAGRAINAVEEQLGKVNNMRRSFGALQVQESQVPTSPRQNFIGCPPNCWRLTDY